jgi:hypothetical protein
MKVYYERAVELLKKENGLSHQKIADVIKSEFSLNEEASSIRRNICNWAKSVDQDALADACKEFGIPIDKVGHYWYKGKHISIHASNKNSVSYEDVRDMIVESMDNHSPSYSDFKRAPMTAGHLLVVDPADVHVGKLSTAFETGEDYNSEIAVKRVMEGVEGILNKVSGFGIDKILLIAGNDILHVDTPRRSTTSGTPQDTDGMWYESFLKAKKLYVDIIERLLPVAPVHFMYNPSNHDYTNGFFLADVIKSWFRNCPDVSFDCSIAHRKYFMYHKNLIGTTHGDGAKSSDLPILMAQEAAPEWASTKHRYIYTHHVHHKTSKDYVGVTIESMRSPSAADSWHHRNGYQHNPKAIEGFVHCKENGQIARITHIF